jgi:hypothetical protein
MQPMADLHDAQQQQCCNNDRKDKLFDAPVKHDASPIVPTWSRTYLREDGGVPMTPKQNHCFLPL